MSIELTDPTPDTSVNESTGGIWGNDNPASSGGDASPKFYNWSTVRTWIKEGMIPWRIPYLVGNWYSPLIGDISPSTPAAPLVNGDLIFCPYLIAETITVDKLGMRISNNVGTYSLGLYASGTNGRPTGNVLSSTADTTGSTGNLDLLSLGASQQLSPGIYWAAYKFSNLSQSYHSVVNSSTWASFQIGSSSASDIAGSATGPAMAGYFHDAAGYNSGTFPSMTGQNLVYTSGSTGAFTPHIIFHVLSKP